MCVIKIMREVGGLSEMLPPIELAHTFNGEDAFHVGTDQKQLYSLDAFPCDQTSLQSFPDLLRKFRNIVHTMQSLQGFQEFQ